MNWTIECGWALLRALAVAALALGAGALFCPLLRSAHGRLRMAAWVLLAVPWLTPIPVVGYAYANCALSLIHHPTLNFLLYHLILCMRLAPVAALTLTFAPSQMSDAALHCHRLLGARGGSPRPSAPRTARREPLGRTTRSTTATAIAGRVGHALFRLRAAARPAGVAFCLVFLLAFAEFELATLMNVRTWTVKLFDAHVGGVPISESLQRIALPAALEALVLLGGYLLLAGARGAETRPRAAKRSGWTWMGAGFLAASLLVVTLIPFSLVAKDAVVGLPALVGSFAIGHELFVSVCFGIAAAALAWCASNPQSQVRTAHRAIRIPQWFLSLPGLTGALVLSLAVLGLFQQPPLRGLYDTPVPLLVGLTFLLLPFALIMRLLFRAHASGSGLFAAEMLRSSVREPVRARGAQLARFIRTRGRFWALFLLFSLAYFDLTASSILAPVGTAPAFVRLYNLMHYGRSALLSAMVLVAFALPLLLLAAAGAGRALYLRMAGDA